MVDKKHDADSYRNCKVIVLPDEEPPTTLHPKLLNGKNPWNNWLDNLADSWPGWIATQQKIPRCGNKLVKRITLEYEAIEADLPRRAAVAGAAAAALFSPPRRVKLPPPCPSAPPQPTTCTARKRPTHSAGSPLAALYKGRCKLGLYVRALPHPTCGGYEFAAARPAKGAPCNATAVRPPAEVGHNAAARARLTG